MSKNEPVGRHFDEEFIAGAFKEEAPKVQDQTPDGEEEPTTRGSCCRSETGAASKSGRTPVSRG